MIFKKRVSFAPAQGVIVVREERADTRVGGVEIMAEAPPLPCGIVVAVGRQPKGADASKIKVGDKIWFTKGMSISVDIVVDGEKMSCRCVSWQDYRGKEIRPWRFNLPDKMQAFLAGVVLMLWVGKIVSTFKNLKQK